MARVVRPSSPFRTRVVPPSLLRLPFDTSFELRTRTARRRLSSLRGIRDRSPPDLGQGEDPSRLPRSPVNSLASPDRWLAVARAHQNEPTRKKMAGDHLSRPIRIADRAW